jgi:hypothetical protein
MKTQELLEHWVLGLFYDEFGNLKNGVDDITYKSSGEIIITIKGKSMILSLIDLINK